jgi:rRNA maturation protein Nop10
MPEDVYCGICGTKLEEIRKCPSCEYTLFLSDRFCRKCGKVVAPTTAQPPVAPVDRDDDIPF